MLISKKYMGENYIFFFYLKFQPLLYMLKKIISFLAKKGWIFNWMLFFKKANRQPSCLILTVAIESYQEYNNCIIFQRQLHALFFVFFVFFFKSKSMENTLTGRTEEYFPFPACWYICCRKQLSEEQSDWCTDSVFTLLQKAGPVIPCLNKDI